MRTSQNLVDMLRNRALETPEKNAYLYVEGNQRSGLSHMALEQKAMAIAARLAEICRPGDRALLLYPPGLEFVPALFGCLAAGVIAVPVSPPHPLRLRRSVPRIQSIVASARPTAVITVSSLSSALRAVMEEFVDLQQLEWLATDLVEADGEIGWTPPAITEETVAVLQYTSGSTADPKGVILSHGNLLHDAAYFDHDWHHTPSSVQVSWLPTFHDLGLVYGVLNPLNRGYLGVLMSPVEVIQYPYRWLQAISELKATHSSGPNFMYDLCVQRIGEEERRTLDLSSWRVALNAAEPVRVETLKRFYQAFEGSGFRWSTFCPGYGLSEATCKVASGAIDEEPRFCHVEAGPLERNSVVASPGPTVTTRTFAGCGRPGFDVGVQIVDPETRTVCPPDRIGEIWVSGPGVGGGYWERPEASEQAFQARLADTGAGPYLRTGDLGFMYQGQLYITGRLKDLVIIRGENHYPQDIEYTVQEAHPALRPGCCAAFSIELEGAEALAVVVEVERRFHERRAADPRPASERRTGEDRRELEPLPPSVPLDQRPEADEIRACIRQAVARAHGLNVSVVKLIMAGSIPKTSSGKIQRRACREQMLTGRLETIPGDDTQGGRI